MLDWQTCQVLQEIFTTLNFQLGRNMISKVWPHNKSGHGDYLMNLLQSFRLFEERNLRSIEMHRIRIPQATCKTIA